MNKLDLEIKLGFITGLKEIVLREVSQHPDLHALRESLDSLYLDFIENFADVKRLRSVTRAFITVQDIKFNPFYISNHKSILGNIIKIVMSEDKTAFKSFKITSAGSDSPEIRDISEYIQATFGMTQEGDPDMKIHIIKLGEVWEVGVQLTPRPLSSRDYRVKNMAGAIDPTVAYAVNSLLELEKAESYLNIFSGSATLLIEAGLCFPNLKRLAGFDNSKEAISLAIQNIKKAGLIRRIQLKEKDIFDLPDLGKFDAITADLPFGMLVSKNEDLEKLYKRFIEYSQGALNKNGKLAIYTVEHELLEKIILKSNFKIIKILELKLVSSVKSYLRPKIFVCSLTL